MSVQGSEINADDSELEELSKEVRYRLRDFVDQNTLLDDVKFSEEEIKRAVKQAESHFNRLNPPISNLDWRKIPENILFLGVTRYLMQAESFRQLRNQVQVQSDNLGAVCIDDKHRPYNALNQQLRQEFKEAAKEWKKRINIQSGFGNLSSGYANVSRFQGD